MNLKQTALIGIVLCTGLTTFVSGQKGGPEWLQWRGPNRDGTLTAFTPPASWPEKLTQKWKIDVGLGYASPLITDNKIYMFSRQGEDEVMSALDAETGKTLWQTRYAAPFEMQKSASRHGAGPKSTPAFANNKLFSIGMTGVVTAFDATTGKQLWQKPGSGVATMYTSHAFSPIVDGNNVIFHVGGHDQGALTAFNVNTGAVTWSWSGDGPSYGSPIITQLGGTRQLVTMTQTKVVGVDPAKGTLLWERPFTNSSVTNSMTPVIYGDTIILGNGGPSVAFAVKKQDDKWVTENVWENSDIPMRLSNPVIVRDVLFAMTTRNSGQYVSADPKTGKVLWTSEPKQGLNASILKAGEQVVSLEEDGELVVFRGSPSGFEEVKRYKVADADTWTQPVLLGNRVFVKDVSTLALWTLN